MLMFSRREVSTDTRGGGTSTVMTVIGKDTEFHGNIMGKGSLRIEGKVEGEIAIQGDLFIGDSGVVRAKVKVQNAVVSGELIGDVECLKRLEVTTTGKLGGDAKTTLLAIEEGAVVRGNLQMIDPKGNNEGASGADGGLHIVNTAKGASQRGDAKASDVQR